MLTNHDQIPLSLAVWLAAPQGYDLKPDPRTISATGLLRPLRSLVLSRRAVVDGPLDLSSLIASKLGTAVHTAAEAAWLLHYKEALENLGYPRKMIDSVWINPTDAHPGDLAVYIEQRTSREIEGFTLSGKFDFVIDGDLHDIKTTSSYTWIKRSNDEKYALQGSIYRFLNPTIITGDCVFINYLFTDWSALKAKADRDYPQSRCIVKKIKLLSLTETENFIRQKIQQIKQFDLLDQNQLPLCTPEELWMDAPTFAYYKDAKKLGRATKLFDTYQEALLRNASDGSKGIVLERKAEPKFCRYCDAKNICSQAEQYVLDGILQF